MKKVEGHRPKKLLPAAVQAIHSNTEKGAHLHERNIEGRASVGPFGNTHSRRVFYSGSQQHVNYSANTPEFREDAPAA